MGNVKVIVSYDGSNYSGWQRQKNTSETIQEKLENVVNQFHKDKSIVYGASRTDAGVHAKGQVFNFDLKVDIPLNRLPQAFNSELPNDIVCLNAEYVSDEFHSRYDAEAKKYIYRIDNNLFRDVFMRKYAYHIYMDLDLDSMLKSVKYLLGEHDFSAFRAKGCRSKNPIKKIYKADFYEEANKIYALEIIGTGFLYNMMRIIAGTVIEIGKRKRSYKDMKEILCSKNRSNAGFTAPAKGLTLEKIYYSVN
ncbi:MAG: tRNA pseudouridine(38-40) synthase TruA [Bacillota bacterium]